jgi:translation initiation factor IF-2
MILLVADVDDLKAVTEGPASGLIIEAHMEQGRGPVAHALVEEGTLKKGDFVVAGGTYARVRNLDSTIGKPLASAGPSTPVVISGFKNAPEFGDQFQVAKNEKEARNLAESNAAARRISGRLDMNSNELIRMINRSNQLSELNIILKADVQGSLTSVMDSLKALDTDEVAVRVVASGVGSITENDMALANTTGAIVYGFNVALPPNIRRLANRDKTDVRLYSIIYELIDDARAELSTRLAPEVQETILGTLQVKAIFKTTKTDLICGGEVQSGKMTIPALARVRRGVETLTEAEVTSLKRGPQDAKEVFEGELCGLSLKTNGRVDLLEGDLIDLYTQETVQRSL